MLRVNRLRSPRRSFSSVNIAIIAPFAIAAFALQSSDSQPATRIPTNIAWTATTISAASNGNAVRGLILSRRCERCHGQEGFSPEPSTPNLAGLDKLSLWKQLTDFHDGKRSSPVMQPIAAVLAPQDLSDIAAYYAMLPTYSDPQDQRAFPQVMPESERALKPARIVAGGDGPRGIPPCQACHGPLATKIGAPSLLSQNSVYIQDQLDAFAAGRRSNDINLPMRSIAVALTPQERQAIADYYGSGEANYHGKSTQ